MYRLDFEKASNFGFKLILDDVTETRFKRRFYMSTTKIGRGSQVQWELQGWWLTAQHSNKFILQLRQVLIPIFFIEIAQIEWNREGGLD